MIDESAGNYRPPSPTSYKGIRYKSKCEAIFARMMDMQNYFQWAYLEPQWQLYPNFEDGYIPDFWLQTRTGQQIFVEYKTTPPKYEYLVALKSRVNQAVWLPDRGINAFVLVKGNPYDNPPNDKWEVHYVMEDDKFNRKDFSQNLSVLKALSPEARNYRFDVVDDGIPDPRVSQLNMDIDTF